MYGFRLYKVRVKAGRRPVSKANFDSYPENSNTLKYIDHLHECWNLLVQQDNLTGNPTLSSKKGAEIEPLSTYSNAKGKSHDRRVNFRPLPETDLPFFGTVWSGTVGSFPQTLTADKFDNGADIEEEAPSRPYRVILFPPLTRRSKDDQIGVLAVESVSRSNPATTTTKWLAMASDALAGNQKKTTESLTANDKKKVLRLRPYPLVDQEYLQEMINSADKVGLTLIKHDINPSSDRSGKEVSLEQVMYGEKRRGTALTWAQSVLNKAAEKIESEETSRKRRGVGNSNRNSISIEDKREWEDIQNGDPEGEEANTEDRNNPVEELKEMSHISDSDIEFDDGYIKITKGDESTVVRPDTIGDIFTYIIDDQRPDDDKFIEEVIDKVKRVEKSHKINLQFCK